MLKQILLTLALTTVVTVPIGMLIGQHVNLTNSSQLVSPLVKKVANIKEKSLEKYAIENLSEIPLQGSPILLGELIDETAEYQQYQFSFAPLGKKMTGSITIPRTVSEPDQKPRVIIMVRGYVPPEIFKTGVGTQNAANVLAENGFITLSPDFFGYGESDPEPEDTWQARFEKPLVVLELLKSIEDHGIPVDDSGSTIQVELHFLKNLEASAPITNVGLWAHSNGGQIALTALEALARPLPTTLWAPVTAPFPYSIQYFSDELEDEGKIQRKWIAQFEEAYDVFDFSLTKHLDLLTGPIQLHHGLADEAAPYLWSDEFALKLDKENERRQKIVLEQEKTATTTAESAPEVVLPPIELFYHRYPNTDHNMKPSWDTVVQRDVEFFKKNIR